MGTGRYTARGAAIAALLLAVTAWPVGAAADTARRVVSLNLCTDQLLVLLADRSAVASVSFVAADPSLSYVADRTAGLALNHGNTEEILPLDPDLVLAGTFTARPAVALLKARGLTIVDVGLAESFDAIRAQTRSVARALGVPERGEALLTAMDARLAATADTAAGPRPSAVLYQANGFTAGAGTLPDAVLNAAGFRNVAADAGLTGYGFLSLERLIAADPDVLVMEDAGAEAPSLAHALLRHPALRDLGAARRPAAIPAGTLACGGPFTAEAVTALADLRQRLETGR
ncbi:MAG: ABC transporter substrate-binding protein [Inquilinaceae bacterium]